MEPAMKTSAPVVRLSIALTLLPLWHSPLAAQSLSTLAQEAQLHDAQYLAATHSLQATLEKVPQARAALLPSLALSASNNQQVGTSEFFDAAEFKLPERGLVSWSWSLQLTQPLLRWGNWVEREQAGALVRQAQAQVAQARQELLLRLAQVYLDILQAHQGILHTQSQLDLADERLAQARHALAAGNGTVTDVAQATARQAQSLAQHFGAQMELDSRQAELERLLGEPRRLAARSIADDLPSLNTDQLGGLQLQALYSNPQILTQEAALDAAQREVEKGHAAHYPTLDLVASQNASYSSGSLGNLSDLPTRIASQQWGFQLNMPLFSGGATQSRVREALALEEKARDELSLARRNVAAQVQQTFSGLASAQAQVAAFKLSVQAGETLVQASMAGLREGARIRADVLSARQELQSSRRDLCKARVEALMLALKLKAAAGVLGESELASVDALLEPLPAN
jgi:outer membrane protein